MTGHTIVIPGQPVAQPRHRVATVNGIARAYIKQDHPVVGFKAYAADSARMVFDEPYSGPVQLTIIAVFKRRSRTPKKHRHREPHVAKPDIDNVIKSVADSLSRIAFVDDSQIQSVVAEKWYAALDEDPHTRVRVTPL